MSSAPVPLEEFRGWMRDYILAQADDMPEETVEQIIDDALSPYFDEIDEDTGMRSKIHYGHPDYDWSIDGAKSLVDSALEYWSES